MKNNNNNINNKDGVKLACFTLMGKEVTNNNNNIEFEFLELKSDKIADILHKKPGIYQLTHTETGKKYIGSAINLYNRVSEYGRPSYVKKLIKNGSQIGRALDKYGKASFKVKILECWSLKTSIEKLPKLENRKEEKLYITWEELSKEEQRIYLFFREQFFMDTLMPEYNVNKIAGSNKGRVYSSTVRAKMSISKKGLVSHRKGKTHRPSSIKLMEINSGRSKKVYVYNIDGSFFGDFTNIQKAALSTGVSRMLIGKYSSKEPTLLKNKKTNQYYIFSLNLISDTKSLLKNLKINTGVGSSKVVNIYLTDGTFFKRFSSIKEATIATGVSKKMILKYSDLEPPFLISSKKSLVAGPGYYFSFKPNFNNSPINLLKPK